MRPAGGQDQPGERDCAEGGQEPGGERQAEAGEEEEWDRGWIHSPSRMPALWASRIPTNGRRMTGQFLGDTP